VHITENLVAFPKFNVEQTVQKYVFNVFPYSPWCNKTDKELTPVIARKLTKDADNAINAIPQHEDHPEQEREYERMES